MPKLMEKTDWMRTVENVSRACGVWSENVNSRDGFSSLVFPESGAYQVILVKLGLRDNEEADVRHVQRIGVCKGKWQLPSWEEDKAMDREIESEFSELA